MTALMVLLLVLRLEDMPNVSACTRVWQLADQIERSQDRAATVGKLIVKPELRKQVVAANNFLTIGGRASQLAKACAI